MRNAMQLSVAPTGTIGIIAGTSGGVEPLFALAYRREHTLGGAPLLELNPVVLRALERRGLDPATAMDAILAAGTIGAVPSIPDDLRCLLVTATEIPVSQHLRIQHACQRHVDNAVSKTINLPEDAPREDVAEAFLLGWHLGLKGVTIYRSGSRTDQVLALGAGEEPMAREAFAKCDPGTCRL